MHGKAVIQHIPWRDRLPVRHFQPASISDVRFYFSPLAGSRLQLAWWERPLSRVLPVAHRLPGNLATPLWAWVKWDHEARLILCPCLLNTSVLPFKCNMTNPDNILCHCTYCLYILWDSVVCLLTVATALQKLQDQFCLFDGPLSPGDWLQCLFSQGHQNPKTLSLSHKWYSIVI